MKKILSILILILTVSLDTSAQEMGPELKRKIGNKKNLVAIMKEVEAHFAEEKREIALAAKRNKQVGESIEEFENEYIHWKRWEYFNRSRLDEKGNLVDISNKTELAFAKVQQQFTGTAQNSSNAQWNFIGPFSMNYQGGFFRGLSRIDRIVFHPTNPSTIFAGSNNGGLWRTDNGGSSWTCISNQFPISSASGIAINPDNPNNIFILTGDGRGGGAISQNSCGIWVTYDGGNNWLKTSFAADRTQPFGNGFKLVMMPGFSNVLIATTDNGLYRSTDFGQTWNAIFGGTFYDIEFDPSNPANVYVSSNGVVYLSTDYGASFPRSSVIGGSSRVELAVTPANSDYVYAITGPFGAVGSNTYGGIYRSTNKGQSFGLRSNSPNVLSANENGVRDINDNDQSWYDLAIEVSRTNANLLVTGGKTVWRSVDGGVTMTAATVFSENLGITRYIHPDIQDLAIQPSTGHIYAGTDGGIYRSIDNGVNWTDLTTNLQATTFYHMGGAQFNANLLLGGTQDNGIKYKKDVSTNFWHINGADGFDCAFGPSANSAIYTTINSSFQSFNINGDPLASITTPINTSFFPAIAADPLVDNNVFLANGAGIWRSGDAGVNWTQVSTQPVITSLTHCRSNSSRYYACQGTSVYRTDDLGASWTADLLPGSSGVSASATDIATNPSNSSNVYITLGGYQANQKVFYSNNAGAGWQNISGTLPEELVVSCIAIDNNNNAYIGTDLGVFYKGANQADWTPFYNGLPKVPITDLSISTATGTIRASTYGRGMWSATLNTACDVNYPLSGSIFGDRFYQASNSMTVTATLSGSDLTRIVTRAGNEVIISDGFIAPERNRFSASIAPCDDGRPVGPIEIDPMNQSVTPYTLLNLPSPDGISSYPLGTVRITKKDDTKLTVELKSTNAGRYTIEIINYRSEKIFESASISFEENTSRAQQIQLNSLQKGTYFIALYNDGKLAHFQDWDYQ